MPCPIYSLDHTIDLLAQLDRSNPTSYIYQQALTHLKIARAVQAGLFDDFHCPNDHPNRLNPWTDGRWRFEGLRFECSTCHHDDIISWEIIEEAGELDRQPLPVVQIA